MSDEVFGAADRIEALPSFPQLFRHIPEPSPVEPRASEAVPDKLISPLRIMEPDPFMAKPGKRRAMGIPANHHVAHQFRLIVIPEVTIGDLLYVRFQGFPNPKKPRMATPLVTHLFVRGSREREVVLPVFFAVRLLEVYVENAVFNFGCKVTIVFVYVIIGYAVTTLKQF